MRDMVKITAFEVRGFEPNPKNYWPNLVGKMRLNNGTPSGVEALRKSLEKGAKK